MIMTQKEMELKIAQLEAELAKKAAEETMGIGCKINENGCISVYGLGGRFPVSLYRNQWTKLLKAIGKVESCLTENKAFLDKCEQVMLNKKNPVAV
jgi:hypothetical protein